MNGINVSVIIPVYNVEKYLEKCVESVIEQKLPGIEIILVDDGSADSSGEICDRLAEHNGMIKVIHKANGGLGSARNRGMEEAVGKYIFFLDSDDCIEENALEILYSIAEKTGAGITVGGINNCYEDRKIPQYPESIEFTCSGSEALKKMLEGKLIPGSSCNKLYLRDLIEKKLFIEDRTYEDALFMPEVLLSTEIVSVTTRPTYSYVHRSGSITTCRYNERAMDVIYAYEYTMDVVKKKCPEYIPEAEFRLQWAYLVVLDRMLETEEYGEIKEYRKVVEYLKKNWMEIFKSRHFTKSRRLSALALKINVRLYRQLLKLQNRRNAIIE